MIAFGVSITDPEPYLQHAEPRIELVAERYSEVFAFSAVGTVGRSNNLLLDAAAARDDLEALVLVHTFTELADPALCEQVRRALSNPDVAVAGCAGASDVRSR